MLVLAAGSCSGRSQPELLPKRKGFLVHKGLKRHDLAARQLSFGNDPSAGSPTERLHVRDIPVRFRGQPDYILSWGCKPPSPLPLSL